MFKLIKQFFVTLGLLGDIAERGNNELRKVIQKPNWFEDEAPVPTEKPQSNQ